MPKHARTIWDLDTTTELPPPMFDLDDPALTDPASQTEPECCS